MIEDALGIRNISIAAEKEPIKYSFFLPTLSAYFPNMICISPNASQLRPMIIPIWIIEAENLSLMNMTVTV